MALLFAAWLAGTLTVVGYILVLYVKTTRRFATAFMVKDCPAVTAWLRQRSGVEVLTTDQTSEPLAYGFFTTRIILPNTLDLTDSTTITNILEHEYVHGRLFHNAFKMLVTLAVAVHWFNPLVWGYWFLCSHDLELACDERVIRHIGIGKRAEYARSLVVVAESATAPLPVFSAFSTRNVKERVVEVMAYKRAGPGMLCLEVIIIIATFAVLGTAGIPQVIPSPVSPRELTMEVIDAEARSGVATYKERALALSNGGVIIKYEIEVVGSQVRVLFEIVSDGKLHHIVFDTNPPALVQHQIRDPHRQFAAVEAAGVIKLEEAERIAVETLGGGRVIGRELEYNHKNHTFQYDIEVVWEDEEYEIEIDATTGTVTNIEIDAT